MTFAAKKAVKLAPGGLHIMLLDIKRPLKEGDKVSLTLTIRGPGNTSSRSKSRLKSGPQRRLHARALNVSG